MNSKTLQPVRFCEFADQVMVQTKRAVCRTCGELAPNVGCSHASNEQIKAARERLKGRLRKRALFKADSEAMGVLLTEIYRDVIVSSARKLRPDLKERDDDFQEVCYTIVKVIRERGGKFSQETLARFTWYLGRVSRNSAANLLKKETQYKARRSAKRTTQKKTFLSSIENVEEVLEGHSEGPHTSIFKQELADLVTAGLAQLEERYGDLYAVPLKLWAVDNLRIKEIAEKIGTGFHVARRRIERARELLRELYRSDLHTMYRAWEADQQRGREQG